MENVVCEKSIIYCENCGNNTTMDCVGEFPKDFSDILDPYTESNCHLMFNCPICNSVIFAYTKVYYHSFDSEIYELAHGKPIVLYPTANYDPTNVPKEIDNAFISAVRTKYIDHAICFLSLRRTLEMICKDKGAKGDLDSMVKSLIGKKILPEMFQNLCDIIRKYGNWSAHGEEIQSKDLDTVIEYVKIIIEYLYSLPYSVNIRLKNIEAIEKRKKGQRP